MSQPAARATGLHYEQTTSHPHRQSPSSYGLAHSQPGCTIHSHDAQPVRPPNLCTADASTTDSKKGSHLAQQLLDKGTGCNIWMSGFFNSVQQQPKFTAQPELSAAFTRWVDYIRHHIEALSHSPPQFSVQLTSTLHEVEEKCDMGGVCIAITLPLRAMGMDEQQCATYGMLAGHDVVVCVEVGRQLSASDTAMAFHFTVQVLTIASQTTADRPTALPLSHSPSLTASHLSARPLCSDGVHSNVSRGANRSSFPLACMLRQRIATLLDSYPPFFPGHAPPPHPLHSFPSAIQSLVASHLSAAVAGRRSLLSLIGALLPENPIVQVMRDVQCALREANRACVVCGDLLASVAVADYGWCGGRLCNETFFSSPYTARIVHPFLHNRPHQLDLFLHVLTAAATTRSVGVMPETVTWSEQGSGGWDRRRFHNRSEVLQALQLVPVLDELLLYDEDELVKQLNDVHPSLLPLLAWTICSYRTHLFTVLPVAMSVAQARNIHHMAVSLRSTITVADMDAYVVELDGLRRQQHRLSLLDGGSPSHSFISGGLWLLHILLMQHGVIDTRLSLDINYTSRQLRAPVIRHHHFAAAVEAALALLSDQRGRRQQVSGWSNSAHTACACVLMVVGMTDEQWRDEMQSNDKRPTKAVEQYTQQKCWVVRAVYTVATEQHEDDTAEKEEEEEEAVQECKDAAVERQSIPEWYECSGVEVEREWEGMRQGWRQKRQQQQHSLYGTDDTNPERDNSDVEQENDDEQQEEEDEEEEEEEEEEKEEEENVEKEEGGEEVEWRVDSEIEEQSAMQALNWQSVSEEMHSLRLDGGTSRCHLSGYSIDQRFSLDVCDDERPSKCQSMDEID